MCYYTFKLNDESSELYIIFIPYGEFCYIQLPMGIKKLPNFAQEIIEEVLYGLEKC
jgi:hypothetical protein